MDIQFIQLSSQVVVDILTLVNILWSEAIDVVTPIVHIKRLSDPNGPSEFSGIIDPFVRAQL